MRKIKTIALVAHDHCKKELLEWVECHWRGLIQYELVCTGTTGNLIEQKLQDFMGESEKIHEINMTKLKSGPLGGDQQMGALISNNEIDVLIFFWDAMEPQPHDVDIKALLRIATLYNVVYACSRSTADFIISSPLFKMGYENEENEQIVQYENRILK
ncbi:MAG: methylglyoxal synthase [Brumimicrobium sp.]